MGKTPRWDSLKSRWRLDLAGDPVLAREIFAIHVFLKHLKIPRARSLESMTPRLEEHKEEGLLHERQWRRQRYHVAGPVHLTTRPATG
jgi:hypothetical protein